MMLCTCSYGLSMVTSMSLGMQGKCDACVQALEQRGVSPDGSDLIRHNMVVFQDGEGALQVSSTLLSPKSSLQVLN